MLKVTPEERISFSELIDRLNPILTVNLESLRKVHLSESAVDLTYMDKQAAP